MTAKVRGHYIEVQGTHVEVVRKDIRNLHVGVYPPGGRVRVAAPLHLDDDALRMAIVAASIGMLPLIVLGALVLFERGTETANYVAGGLVGLAPTGL